MSQQHAGPGAKNKTLNKSTYLVLILSLGAMAFFGVCSPQGYQGQISGIAGSVGKEEISQQEFIRAYERQGEQMKRQYGEEYDPAALRLAQTVLDQLLDDRMLYQKGTELGLTATDDEVVEYLNSVAAFRDEKGAFSEETFRNFLRGNRYTEASFQEELRRMLTLQRLRQMITSTAYVSTKAVELDYKISETKLDVAYVKVEAQDLGLTATAEDVAAFMKSPGADDKIKAWYLGHESDFKQEEKVHARHILLSYQGARNASAAASKRSEAEAKQKAADILAKVQAPGADFVAIAKAETDDESGRKSGGDLGYFTRSNMVKEFSDAAFVLQKGQLSEVVASPFGFHIIQLVDRQEAKNTTLDEAKESIVQKLIVQDKGPRIASEKAQELLTLAAKGDVDQAWLEQNKLSWQKTGPITLSSRYIPGLGSQQDIRDAILTLSTEKPLYPQVVKSGQAYYVLKLAEMHTADLSKLDAEKKKQMAASAAFANGYGFYTNLEAQLRKEYEKASRIYKNPEYLALDQQKNASQPE